jgi:hypothetical protein
MMKKARWERGKYLPRHGSCTRLSTVYTNAPPLFPPNSMQTTTFPRHSCNQPLLNHPLNSTTLVPPSSTTSPQTLTIANPRYETPKSRRTHHQRVKKQKTKMTSRIPNPSAPRLSTAPSSIKPRQLVRHLLVSLHSSSLSISATPPHLHFQHLPSPPSPLNQNRGKESI